MAVHDMAIVWICEGCGVSFPSDHPPHQLECVPARPVQHIHLVGLQPIVNRLLMSAVTERLIVQEEYDEPNGRKSTIWRVACDPLSHEWAEMMAGWWMDIAKEREARDRLGLCRKSDVCPHKHGHDGACSKAPS